MALSEDLLNGARAAAEFSGLSTRTIYHMVEAGTLPAVRVGKRRLYFRKSDLEATFRSNARA